MKKEYIKPFMVLEDFNADEYIAACWGVGCDTSKANKIETSLKNNPVGGHQSRYCGQFSHQHIFTDSDGTPKYMQEDDSPYGDLYCTLYTDSTYKTELDITSVKPGDTIYWITYGTSTRSVYHHVGTVEEQFPGNPNHS